MRLLWHEVLLLGLDDQINALSTFVYAGEEILNGTKWDGWHLNNYQYQGQFRLSSVAPVIYAADSHWMLRSHDLPLLFKTVPTTAAGGHFGGNYFCFDWIKVQWEWSRILIDVSVCLRLCQMLPPKSVHLEHKAARNSLTLCFLFYCLFSAFYLKRSILIHFMHFN